jgi:hypothetical protein
MEIKEDISDGLEEAFAKMANWLMGPFTNSEPIQSP